jgi:serine/threonine protein kinase
MEKPRTSTKMEKKRKSTSLFDSKLSQDQCEKLIFHFQDRYSFIDRLPSDGDVFLCHVRSQESFQEQKVVLKVVLKVLRDNSEREIKIMHHLAGIDGIQHLIQIHKFESWNVLVTKYAPNTSFIEIPYNSSHPKTHARIIKYMKQLLTIVKQCHERGIIIRDIKPGNLMWDEESGKLVMIDFELAEFYREQGHTSWVGTDGFMAPEVEMFGKPYIWPPTPYSLSVDIYSAGVTLGSLLFQVEEADITAKTVRTWRKYLRKHFSEKIHFLENMFLAMTEPRSEDRPDATECLEQLI